jgi:4-hydroxy-2-oxoheptanedioate aldolase
VRRKMKKNGVLEKLRNGECVTCVNIGFAPLASLVELAGKIGFDCVWFDMEHRTFGLKELSEMALACRATGMEAMTRPVKGNYTSIMKPLEAGSTGLMVPHCLTAGEVRQIVSWAKYPPLGRRGFDNAGPDADYVMAGMSEYVRHANEETFLMIQIEDREGVENIEEIAAIDGVDVIFVGPADLSMSYGVFPEFSHRYITQAIERIASAAAKNKKWWGMPMGSVEKGKKLVGMGARFLTYGADLLALRDGFMSYRKSFEQVTGR